MSNCFSRRTPSSPRFAQKRPSCLSVCRRPTRFSDTAAIASYPPRRAYNVSGILLPLARAKAPRRRCAILGGPRAIRRGAVKSARAFCLLIESRGFPTRPEFDSRCWLEQEASMDAESLFARPKGPGDRGGRAGRDELPVGGPPFWGW